MNISVLLLFVVLSYTLQQSQGHCPLMCHGADLLLTAANKSIERVPINSLEEARWRGACHSFCISDVDKVSTFKVYS